MEESKNAAKGSMAMYFPVKKPNPLKSDILDSIFPPNKQQGNAVYESPNVHNSEPADGNPQDSCSKSQGTYQKDSGLDFIDDSDPCYMCSSVEYGCRVYYPSSKQHAAGYDMDFTDGNSQDSHSKSQGTYQKDSGSDFIDDSDPCYMSSSVEYGCRVYYPSSKQHPGDDMDFADGNSQDSGNKSHGTYQKASGSVFIDASDPCYMSSSVDYGCRDYYPSYKQHPGGYDIDEDKKDGYDCPPDPENSRGEWWQGSLYY